LFIFTKNSERRELGKLKIGERLLLRRKKESKDAVLSGCLSGHVNKSSRDFLLRKNIDRIC